MEKCADNMTVAECRALTIEPEPGMQKCYDDYDKAIKNYNKNFFITSSIIGVILLVVSYFLFYLPNIGAGVAFAGIVLILVSFVRGWQSTDDILKFVVAIVIAAIVIFFSVKTNKSFDKKKVIKKKK
jgi:VIT1/CCC1 family predicted Fe2+/Mn2+ transporter